LLAISSLCLRRGKEVDEANMHKAPLTFAHFIGTAETRAALLAIQELAEQLGADRPPTGNPLMLHGPTGTGKTHLVSALVQQVTRVRPEWIVAHLGAADFTQAGEADEAQQESARPPAAFALAQGNDVLIVEDLQHLHASAVGRFTELVDDLLARGQPLVFTADTGPQQLRSNRSAFSARLISRLAGGVVVGLQPPGEVSRLTLLREHCKRLNISEEVLTWLAQHITGGVRSLLGALQQLKLLAEAGETLDLETVTAQFQVQAEHTRVSVDSIARQVSRYFQVEAKQLCSRRRWRHVLVPRQVGMYLARQLTTLSLEEIGAYFGGRDHSTVLHACRKVEQALGCDVALSGAVRHLQTELV
jgi:chromosomal replication initiator protein